MLVVIFIATVIVLLMIALLAAYLNLRSTVEIMKNTINWQNERYTVCLEGWERALQFIELNKQLYSDLYNNKEE